MSSCRWKSEEEEEEEEEFFNHYNINRAVVTKSKHLAVAVCLSIHLSFHLSGFAGGRVNINRAVVKERRSARARKGAGIGGAAAVMMIVAGEVR